MTLENELKNVSNQIDKQVLMSNNLLQLYSEGAIMIEKYKLHNEVIQCLKKLLKRQKLVQVD